MGILHEQHVVGLLTLGLRVGAWFQSVLTGEALRGMWLPARVSPFQSVQTGRG